jgi:type III secretion system FlhB-like substrate exporter
MKQKGEQSKQLLAAALRYNRDSMSTPEMSAAAEGELAKQLLSLARRFGVPVKRLPDLAEKLSKLPANTEIPEELFDPVAKLLVECGVSDKMTGLRRSKK